MVQKCKICGKHTATRVTVDAHGQRCAHCGYCQRWQRADITAYLQGQHLFAQAVRQPTGQVTVGERAEQVAPASVIIECDCPEHGDDCGTWLELTPDGFLALEDKDGSGFHSCCRTGLTMPSAGPLKRMPIRCPIITPNIDRAMTAR